MAATRRPYGVDHFDLVLALRTESSVSNLSFSRLRILDLYDDSLHRQILNRLTLEARDTGAQVMHVAAGHFSWGDALHTALGHREQQSASIEHRERGSPLTPNRLRRDNGPCSLLSQAVSEECDFCPTSKSCVAKL